MLALSAIGPDMSPTPDRLFLALEKGGRVFIANLRLTAEVKAIPACDALRASYERKANAAGTASTAATEIAGASMERLAA